MKCPHCLIEFHGNEAISFVGTDRDGDWWISSINCPSPTCGKVILHLLNASHVPNVYPLKPSQRVQSIQLVRPKGSNRPPVPIQVTKDVANDYVEACLTFVDSPKASAALSRRCLQNLLVEKAKVAKGDLSKQIQEVLDSGKLPSHLEESIDAIRNIGNFAAHPNKSKSTGEIVDVEPHEAEWTLDVLEDLFDFYYVQPEKSKLRRAALDAKLGDTGKPPMK